MVEGEPLMPQSVLVWLVLLLVPLTVLVFSRFDRKYYLAGLAIIVLTTAAFFLHFESRKPQARELSGDGEFGGDVHRRGPAVEAERERPGRVEQPGGA